MSERNVVIVLHQFSVVVKGIEKKLLDKGYHVDMVTENFEKAVELTVSADAFLLYLPSDIMENKRIYSEFAMLSTALQEKKASIIMLGEKKYHHEFEESMPNLRDYLWYDRPVDMDELDRVLIKVIDEGGVSSVRKRILIVDDDHLYAGMVREWLKDLYRVDVVTAGMQAITFLLKNPVDLILLDYEMPIVDGPQVLQMLRQDQNTANIPVLFLTGVGTKEEVARVMALKPDGYVLKSTTRESLLQYIRSKI